MRILTILIVLSCAFAACGKSIIGPLPGVGTETFAYFPFLEEFNVSPKVVHVGEVFEIRMEFSALRNPSIFYDESMKWESISVIPSESSPGQTTRGYIISNDDALNHEPTEAPGNEIIFTSSRDEPGTARFKIATPASREMGGMSKWLRPDTVYGVDGTDFIFREFEVTVLP